TAQQLPAPSADAAAVTTSAPAPADPFMYLKVLLNAQTKLKDLKPGDAVEGKLASDVYWRDRELFPAGSAVHLVVDKLERRRREPNDHWPWVIKVFTPRHENYPTFRSGTIALQQGNEIPLDLSLVSSGKQVFIQAPPAKHKSAALPANAPVAPTA